MNGQTRRLSIAGSAGAIECAIDEPAGAVVGVAVVCHPHPLHGGTLDNKVVQTLARSLLQRGLRTVRFNFRGIGGSAGSWDEGIGEVQDALAVVAAHRVAGQPLLLAGFSFGGYVAAQVWARLPDDAKPQRLILVGPSTQKQVLPVVPADTVVVHGEADEVVPLSATLDWARPQHLPVIVLPGVGHFFHGQLALLKAVLLQQLRGADG
jgi:alpha/beta superfamily hydrolase